MRKERALSTLFQLIALWLLAHVAPTDAVWGASVRTEVFDEKDNVVLRVDGNGNEVRYSYDICGRLVSRTAADGADAFAYDEVGNLVAASNAVAVETFAYDLRDRLTNAVTQVGANTWEQAWQRDAGGLVTNIVYAPGKAVTWAYDTDGRLVAVSDWLGHEWTFTYDGVGKHTGGTSPDGTEHAFAYDAAGRLVGWNVGAIMGRTIERDAAGRRVCDTVTAGSMPVSFVDRRAVNTFDTADRLVSASVTYAVTNAPVTETYIYDGNGALTNATSGGEIVFAAEYNAHGRLVLLGKGEWGTGNGEWGTGNGESGTGNGGDELRLVRSSNRVRIRRLGQPCCHWRPDVHSRPCRSTETSVAGIFIDWSLH